MPVRALGPQLHRLAGASRDVLLLDEPTTHLDISHQVEILELVKRLNREQGVTVIAAMHDLNLAAAWADDLVLMSAGRVAAAGSPAEVLRPEVLSPVYDTPLEVRLDEATGRPYVLLRCTDAR